MILNVGNRKLNFWSEYDLTLSFNSVASVFNFKYYYDNESRTNRDISALLYYKFCAIERGGERLLTGTILNHSFTSRNKKELSNVSGYSRTGVLNDVNVPPSLYPLQFDNLTLLEIAEKICNAFNIGVQVDSSVMDLMNEIIEKTELEPTDKIADFLSELAAEKNIVLSHTSFGRLLFTRANTEQDSVFDFGNDSVSISKALKVNGQKMYSEVTAMAQSSEVEESNASETTINNPYVSNFRPLVVKQRTGDDRDSEQVARTALGNQLRAISLTIDVNRWTDKNGNFWKPNTIVSVVDQNLKIFRKARFFVESVKFKGDSTKEEAQLTCVLPEVYNDKNIRTIF